MKKVFKQLKMIPSCNLWCILILIPFLRLIVPFAYDNDFWFTINQGKYVIENGFPYKAIGIIHNFDFIYQSWGTGTLFYLIYHYLGDYGMIMLLIMVYELMGYFFYKLCLRVSGNKRISLIITIVMILFYSIFVTTRPHLFTSLNLVIMLYLMESYYQTLNKKYLYFLPILSLLQINMHGIYFLPIMIILLPYLINAFKFRFGKIVSNGVKKKALFIVFIMMLLTGFINPYGYKTIIYGFTSYFSNSIMNNMIIELLSPNFHQLLGKIIIGSIIIIYVLYFTSRKKLSIRYFLLLLGTSFLALDAIKSFWLFLICAFFPLAIIFSYQSSELKYSKKYYFTHLMIVVITIALIISNISINKKIETQIFLDYLDNHVQDKGEIKLYTDFNDGSYAEWRGYLCYLDPRAEVFLKANNHQKDIIKEAHELQTLKLDYQVFLEEYQFDYLLINKKENVLYELLKLNNLNYQEDLDNDNYILYKRVNNKKG